MFADTLAPHDLLYMAPIPYMGGTAVRDISSNDLVNDVRAKGFLNAQVIETRDAFLKEIQSLTKPGDLIAIVGGRDATLPFFARDVAGVFTPPPVDMTRENSNTSSIEKFGV